MKKILSLLAPALLLTAFSCAQQETEAPVQKGREITFVSSIGSFTRVAGNAFEEGDVAGLYVSEPISETTTLTWSGNGFTTPEKLYWPVDATPNTTATFVAWYPKVADSPFEDIRIDLPLDQSSKESYEAADFLAAEETATPNDEVVYLQFEHMFSRLLLTVDDQMDENHVKAVTVTGLRGTAYVDYAYHRIGVMPNSSNEGSFIPLKSDNKYALVVAPQEAVTTINVILTDDTVFTYTSTSELDFEPGHQIKATLVVAEGGKLSFTADITDWIDDEVYFGGEGHGEADPAVWSVYYEGPNGDYMDYDMEDLENGSFKATINYYAETAFAIRKDHSMERYYCSPIPNYLPELKLGEEFEMTLFPTGTYAIGFEAEGVIDLVFTPSTGKLKATLTSLDIPEEPNEDWEYMGTGTMLDGLVGGIFTGVPNAEFPVEIYISKDGTRAKVANPYAKAPWRDEFTYDKSGELIFNISDPDKIYLEDSYTGLSDEGSSIYVASYVPENGYSIESPYYGYFSNGNLRFNAQSLLLFLGEQGYYANTRGYFTICLPGYGRDPIFCSINVGFEEENPKLDIIDGNVYARVFFRRGFDDQEVRYALYEGNLSREEIISECVPAVQDIAEGVQVLFLPDDYYNLVDIPISHSGTYTILGYSTGNHGNYSWQFRSFSVLIPGEEAPDFEMTLTAAPFAPLPESAVEYHINFPAIDTLKTLVVPKAALLSENIGPESYLDLLMENGTTQNTYYFDGKNGTTYRAAYLSPETEYVVIAGGCDSYGNYGAVYAEATTGSEPTLWNEAGTGTYYDFTGFFNDPQSAHPSDTLVQPVMFKTSRQAPGRYRIENPYKLFWLSASEEYKSEYYKGSITDCFDIFFQEHNGETYIYYTDIYTGFIYPNYASETNPDSGEFVFEHTNLSYTFPGFNQSYYYNTAVADGVYNIAPYVYVVNAGYFNWTTYYDVAWLVMPGYELPSNQDEPVAGGTSVRKARRTNAPELDARPMFSRPVTKVTAPRPRILKTGTPVLVAPAPGTKLSWDVKTL